MEQIELDSRYGSCCRDSKNWEYCCIAGEVYCNKCGRVLPDTVAVAMLE